jgi:hypothetical protein
MAEATQVKPLSGAQLLGRPPALPTNIRLGWKGLPGTNALAYYKNLLITASKSFIRFAPEGGTESAGKHTESFLDIFLANY